MRSTGQSGRPRRPTPKRGNSKTSKTSSAILANAYGFSAETDKILQNSKIKLKNKNADWIIANDVSKKDVGFNKDYNEVTVIKSNGNISQIKKSKKSFIASILTEKIINELLINEKKFN